MSDDSLGKTASDWLKSLAEQDFVDMWADSIKDALKEPAFQRDPEFIRNLLPKMELLNRYFDSEVRGMDKLPADGPMLIVGNHSGGTLTPDTTAFISAWYRHRGVETPLTGLAFDAAFSIPGFRNIMRKLGQVPASMKNAGKALADGSAVLVYPGGVHEVFRPWTERNRVDFNQRKGFIRLALEHQVPIVPIVGHGGHETTVVLTRGEGLAKRFGLDRLRMNTYPILFQIPWGVTTPAFPGLPLPAKITIQVCEPVRLDAYKDRDPNDPEVLQEIYDEVVGSMQRTLSQLAEENPQPIRSRLASLLGG